MITVRRGARPVARRPVAKLRADPLGVVPGSAEQTAERAIAKFLGSLPAAVDVSALADAIGARDARRAASSLPELSALVGLPRALKTAVVETGRREARRTRVVAKDATISYSFALAEPRAATWAEERAAELVVEISEATRESIRALVVRAVREGGHPYVVARAIRPLIGLHSRWATAVLNRRFALEAQGVAPARVESLTSAYYQRLLRTRAKTIARTEILGAANQGKMLAWQEALRLGLFTEEPSKLWIAAGDAEPICAELDGTTAALSEDFATELGEFAGPPIHPNCRCTLAVTGRKNA